MRARLLAIHLVIALFAACGGTTVTSTATGGAGGSPGNGGSSTTTGDGGCINPTVGQPCTAGDVACQPVNPCCAGYEWMCDATSNTWQQAGLGCACQAATPFTCGSTMCQGGAYCEDHAPGIATADGGTPPDSYDCAAIPSSCLAAPSCDCIGDAIPAGDPCSTQTLGVTCTEDSDGHVTLHCLGI